MKYTTINHMFGAKDTVVAAIRKYNGYTTDTHKLEQLLALYNELNGQKVPHLCEIVQIPILDEGDK